MPKKKLLLGLLLLALIFPLAAQVSVDPNDPIYTDISNWENLGIIRNVPPLRPYPLKLISSFLETVMQSEYEDQAAIANAYWQQIFGKTVDAVFEGRQTERLMLKAKTVRKKKKTNTM